MARVRYIKTKNRASSRLLAKNRVSQVFWDPIKNRVSPRSALLEAVYLKALVYWYSTVRNYSLMVGNTSYYAALAKVIVTRE